MSFPLKADRAPACHSVDLRPKGCTGAPNCFPLRKQLLVGHSHASLFGRMPSRQTEVDPAMLAAMERAGVAPKVIYACRKTGLLVDEEGYKRLCPKDRKTWDDAIAEFERLQAAEKQGQ